MDSLELLVGHLEAHVSLEAKAANLVALSVGAAVTIEDVDVLLRGVSAQQVKLIVRLGNVNKIIDRTLESLDRNPDLYIVTNSLLFILTAIERYYRRGWYLANNCNWNWAH